MENELIILFIGVLFLLWLLNRKQGRKGWKKKYNIRKADEVINKLNSFEGDGREARCLAYLRKISPYVFEELLLTAFQKRGYTIERNKRYSGDGGIDGRVFHENRMIPIQAKRYKSYIQVQHLRDFEELIELSGSTEGYFIHTGRTSKPVLEKYRNSKVKIISGNLLIDLILN